MTTIFIKSPQDKAFQTEIYEIIQKEEMNKLIWCSPQAPDQKLYEPCFALNIDQDAGNKFDRFSHFQIGFWRNSDSGSLRWNFSFQDPDDISGKIEFPSAWYEMDSLSIAQLEFLFTEMESIFYLYFACAGENYLHWKQFSIPPEIQTGIRKLCPELGKEIDHVEYFSIKNEQISMEEISPFSIQSCGLLLGSMFFPYDEIVQLALPKHLIFSDRALARVMNDTSIPLGQGEGTLSIKWKAREDSRPQDIILILKNADSVREEILKAQKIYRNKLKTKQEPIDKDGDLPN